jgi:hypothetical protein
MALASITVTTGVTIQGRALARTAAVTLDTDTITSSPPVTAPGCPQQPASARRQPAGRKTGGRLPSVTPVKLGSPGAPIPQPVTGNLV